MRISFQTDQTEMTRQNTEKLSGFPAQAADRTKGQSKVASDIFSVGGKDKGNGLPFTGHKEKTKSLIELQQEAGFVDVGVKQDYMTVMANTLSEEDYAELEKNGFHFENMDPDEAVTIVDKIKATMAQAGHVVAGYNDDIDMEALAEAVGSETLARAVAESFAENDIPVTKGNLSGIRQAWDMASQLTDLQEGTISYLVENELEPEIWNLYLAQSSGSSESARTGRQSFAEDASGFLYRERASGDEGLQKQMDQIIEEAGFTLDDASRNDAKWLLDRDLAVTADNLSRLKELKEIKLPVTKEAFAGATARAVTDGKSPIHANLSEKRSIYEKANDLLAYFADESNFSDSDFTIGDQIAARRQLEEIRFRMTAEVNVRLLKSDFAIDTAPMEQLLEALKKAEAEVAGIYFPKDDAAVDKYHILNQTEIVMRELPVLPADILGTYSARNTDISLGEFHREGAALRDTYIRANESYEALMTAPRKDLGDSIRKAFVNVDDIVKDLGLELRDENRRAVRILGYNSMEITPENIEKVREADREVNDLMKKFTPAATLKMIRDGINPLEKSFEELNDYLDSDSKGFEEQAESYSRFLYKLESKKEITESERESYIGVYRLLRQIEKTDGAVVGALINSNAEMHFSNLLSAVRSGRFKGLDVKVEDSFRAVMHGMKEGSSISEQIAKAFVGQMDEILEEVSDDENATEAYFEEEVARLRSVPGLTDGDVAGLLQKGEIPANAGNLLAANVLLHGGESLYAEMGRHGRAGRKNDRYDHIWEELDQPEKFKEEYGDMLQEMESRIEEVLPEESAFVDVKNLQLIHKQISVARQVSEKEEYFVPMYVGERLAEVHLTIQHGEGEKGNVHISMDLENESTVQAHFTLNRGRLDGFFVGNSETEVTKLKGAADIMNSWIKEGVQGLEGIVSGDMSVVHSSSFVTQRQGTDARPGETDGADNNTLYRIAKLFLQAVQ